MSKINDISSRIIFGILIVIFFIACFLLLSPPTYSKYVTSSTFNQSVESNDVEKPWEYTYLKFSYSQTYEVGYNKVLNAGKYYFTYDDSNYYFVVKKNMGEGSKITLNSKTGKINEVWNPDTTGYTKIGFMNVVSGTGTIESTLELIEPGKKYYFSTNTNQFIFFTSTCKIPRGSKVTYNANTGLLYGPQQTYFAQSKVNLKSIDGKDCLIGTKFNDGKWYFMYCNDSSNMSSYWYVSASVPLGTVGEQIFYLDTNSNSPIYYISSVSDSNYKMIIYDKNKICTKKNGSSSSSGRLGRRRATNYAVFGQSVWSSDLNMVGDADSYSYDPNTLRMTDSQNNYLYLDNIDSQTPVKKTTNNTFPWRITWGVDPSEVPNLDMYVFYEQKGYLGNSCEAINQTTANLDFFTRYPKVEK